MKLNNMKKFLVTFVFVISNIVSIRPALACGSGESFIASMCVFAGNFAPRSYALAQGQLLAISQNSALFALLGTTYGGDGRTTFALPDTRGRVVIGAGNGPGLSNYNVGQKSGSETVTLSTAQMPSHTHTATTTTTGTATAHSNSSGNTDTPSGNVWSRKPRDSIYSSSAPDVTMNANAIFLSLSSATSVSNTGGSTAHENRMPYIAMNWIITLQGIFPSRN